MASKRKRRKGRGKAEEKAKAQAAASGKGAPEERPQEPEEQEQATDEVAAAAEEPAPASEEAQREDEGEGPEGDVEAAERVVGVDPGPARRRRPHEVAPDVVAHLHPGEAGDLGGMVGHELPGDPDVHRGVDVLTHVEQECSIRADTVHGVLREGEQPDQEQERGKRALERGARGPLPPQPGEQ